MNKTWCSGYVNVGVVVGRHVQLFLFSRVFIVAQLSDSYLKNAGVVESLSFRLAALTEAQNQTSSTMHHNKEVLDNMSRDFYKLLLEQIAWIMVELKVAKADRASRAAATESGRVEHNTPDDALAHRNTPVAAAPPATQIRGNISIKAIQSIEKRLDDLTSQQQANAKQMQVRLCMCATCLCSFGVATASLRHSSSLLVPCHTCCLQSMQRRLQDMVAGLGETPTMRAMTSELMGNMISQMADVSKGMKKLLGTGPYSAKGRIAEARAAEAKADEKLQETRRLISSFNDHMFVRLQIRALRGCEVILMYWVLLPCSQSSSTPRDQA